MASKVLVGKTITAVHLADDGGAIRFDVVGEDKPIIARADGDCCSRTWIEAFDNPQALLGQVQAVEDLYLDRQDDQDGNMIQFYGCKITTDKGVCVIDYRNESNGYYGGNLSWPDDSYFYGGVYGQNVSKEKWRQIA